MADEKEQIPDLIQYIRNSAGASFSDKAFNATDGLILAQLSYFNWSKAGIDYDPSTGGIAESRPLSEAIYLIKEKYRARSETPDAPARDKYNYMLLEALEESNRFKHMTMSGYYQTMTKRQDAGISGSG